MAWNRFRIARTTEALRVATTYQTGEFIQPKDGANAWRPYIGDASTVGGRPLAFKDEAAAGLRGSIFGLTMFNNSTDANNDIDIAAGAARDSTNVYDLTLASGTTKRLDAAWSVGSNGGGLDTGSKAANTSYHVHLIRRATDGVIDALFSTSPTSPTMPSGWTARRRIGAILTDASGNIKTFRQVGGWFHYKGTLLIDVENVASSPTPVLRTLLVPKGIKVRADLNVLPYTSGGTPGTYYTFVTDPDLGVVDSANSFAAIGMRITADMPTLAAIMVFPQVWTDAAGRVYTADSQTTGGFISLITKGWFDPRDEYL